MDANRSQWRFSSNFVDPPDISLLQDSSSDKGATAAPRDSPGVEERCRSNDNSSEDGVSGNGPSLDRHLDTSLSLADHLITPKQNEQGTCMY